MFCKAWRVKIRLSSLVVLRLLYQHLLRSTMFPPSRQLEMQTATMEKQLAATQGAEAVANLQNQYRQQQSSMNQAIELKEVAISSLQNQLQQEKAAIDSAKN